MVAVLVILLPTLFHLTRYLGASADNPRKNEVYESGIRKTVGDPFERIDVRYLVVGLVFIVFDVEVLYLFPWAVGLRDLGVSALVEMFIFLALLGGGLLYIYKSGVLRWT
jgi:NADH-quinone oxidoreductase subunit A